jgi:hypothetical protein
MTMMKTKKKLVFRKDIVDVKAAVAGMVVELVSECTFHS